MSRILCPPINVWRITLLGFSSVTLPMTSAFLPRGWLFITSSSRSASLEGQMINFPSLARYSGSKPSSSDIPLTDSRTGTCSSSITIPTFDVEAISLRVVAKPPRVPLDELGWIVIIEINAHKGHRLRYRMRQRSSYRKHRFLRPIMSDKVVYVFVTKNQRFQNPSLINDLQTSVYKLTFFKSTCPQTLGTSEFSFCLAPHSRLQNLHLRVDFQLFLGGEGNWNWTFKGMALPFDEVPLESK